MEIIEPREKEDPIVEEYLIDIFKQEVSLGGELYRSCEMAVNLSQIAIRFDHFIWF